MSGDYLERRRKARQQAANAKPAPPPEPDPEAVELFDSVPPLSDDAAETRIDAAPDTPEVRVSVAPPDDDEPELPSQSQSRYPLPMPGEQWSDPYRLARLFFDQHRTMTDGLPTLLQWRDQYHRWNGAAWLPVPDGDLDARIAAHARDVFEQDMPQRVKQEEFAAAEAERKPRTVTLYPVTSSVKANIRTNLAGLANLPDNGREPPFWLMDAGARPLPHVVVPAPNGLFRLEDIANGGKPFSAPTPTFFSPTAIPFAVESDPEPPTTWLRCLNEWFDGDAASVNGLLEWFGYLLTADTSTHKILLLCGPPRSGKGTILHVLTELVGAPNVASTSFAALGESFGLEALLGKRVAIVPDARLSGRTDSAAVVERLLSISGEDSQTINRKNRPRITARLGVRFVLASNEVPRLPDASGAVATRFHILKTPNSWLGKEDRGLKAKLAHELPGILRWAAQGWCRLRAQGMAFTANDAAVEYQRELEDLASPIRAFVRECCTIGPACEIDRAHLFQAWRDWNEAMHREHGSEIVFGRDLRSALPHLKDRQTNRHGGARRRLYVGVTLKPRDEWGME